MPTAPRSPCTLCGAPAVDKGRCARHRRTTTQRGYDAKHKALRAHWAPKVVTGTVRCGRPTCGELIEPGEPWDLGHTDDRRGYHGPEHQDCNRAAARKRLR